MLSSKFRVVVAMPTNCRLVLCALALSCLLNIADAPIAMNFDQRVLAAHNIVRQQFGLSPLRWDPRLAVVATERAKQLAAAHIFAHAPDNAVSPQGENIWGGTKGYYSAEAMVNAWSDEQQYFKPGIFPDNSTTGKVEDVGHFTQVAWRTTTDVGCGIAQDGDYDILVCHYYPAGNYVGERPF